jgi:alpha-tubulin suppressor-like RCC1 family protein
VNATSSCALDSSGQAFCWGKNSSGQLGNGTTTDAAAPTPVATDLRFRAIAAGFGHTCAVALDGGAYCWGNNQLGQLGTGSVSTAATPVTSPVAVAGGLRFSSITAGSTHSCALGEDGRAYCWGDNASGQLGTGDLVAHPSPTLVAGGITWSRLSTSNGRVCGVSTDHRLYCWGSGQLVPQLQIGQQ